MSPLEQEQRDYKRWSEKYIECLGTLLRDRTEANMRDGLILFHHVWLPVKAGLVSQSNRGEFSAEELAVEASNRAGCVQLRYCRDTGFLVGVYRSAEAGIEADPASPWTTLCEKHGLCCCHPNKRLALSHAAMPEWCAECQVLMRD